MAKSNSSISSREKIAARLGDFLRGSARPETLFTPTASA